MQPFEEIQTRLMPELTRMNAIIRDSLATSNPLMNQIVENYLRVKGKQIRPILVILSARFFGNVTEETLYAGAALEMLHNASLIHDDVVDETSLRRGNQTINSLWGNHLAVLTGDFFVSNALAAGISTGHLSIIRALSDLGKELSLGEVDQICNVREHNFDEESYLEMIRKKTASLFMHCVKMGAQTSGSSSVDYGPMVEFAERLGLCFQIRDDIFDYYDDPRIGKPTGNDLREGKVTLPLLHALAVATDVAEVERLKGILRRGNLSSDEIAELVEFAKGHGGIEYSYGYMQSLRREAEDIIMRYPASEWREAFLNLFRYIIERDR